MIYTIIYLSFLLFILSVFIKIKLNKKKYSYINKSKFIIINLLDTFLLLLIYLSYEISIFALRIYKFLPNLLIQIFLIFIIFILIKNEDNDFKNYLFPKISFKEILNSIIFCFPIIISIFFIFVVPLIYNRIIVSFNLEKEFQFMEMEIQQNEDLGIYLKSSINSRIECCIIFIINLLVGAFFEEYLFRYKFEYDYNLYIDLFSKKNVDEFPKKNNNIKIYIWISVVFSIFHLKFNLLAILSLFIFSMFLFWYKKKVKSIIPLCILHFIYNILVYFT